MEGDDGVGYATSRHTNKIAKHHDSRVYTQTVPESQLHHYRGPKEALRIQENNYGYYSLLRFLDPLFSNLAISKENS